MGAVTVPSILVAEIVTLPLGVFFIHSESRRLPHFTCSFVSWAGSDDVSIHCISCTVVIST